GRAFPVVGISSSRAWPACFAREVSQGRCPWRTASVIVEGAPLTSYTASGCLSVRRDARGAWGSRVGLELGDFARTRWWAGGIREPAATVPGDSFEAAQHSARNVVRLCGCYEVRPVETAVVPAPAAVTCSAK